MNSLVAPHAWIAFVGEYRHGKIGLARTIELGEEFHSPREAMYEIGQRMLDDVDKDCEHCAHQYRRWSMDLGFWWQGNTDKPFYAQINGTDYVIIPLDYSKEE